MRHPAAQIPVRRVVVTRFDRKMTCPPSPSRDRLSGAFSYGRSNTALPLARPICRFCRSVPPGSLAFADVTDCGYSRAFTYVLIDQVFHAQDTPRYGSTLVPAPCSEQYFPGLTPSAPPREGMKRCTQ